MFRKSSIRFFGGCFVSLVGFLRIFKKAEVNTLTPNRKMGLPFLSPFMPRYSNIAGLIVGGFRPIHAILLMRHFTQIAQSIVRPISIYMVDLPKRPEPIGYSHSNSVRWNYGPIDANFNVAIAKGASAVSGFCPLRCVFPYEVPGIGIIGKFFVQSGYRNFSHSYDISLLLNGGKYASIIG